MRYLLSTAYLLLASLRTGNCATTSISSVLSTSSNEATTSTTASYDAYLTEVPTNTRATYPGQDTTSTNSNATTSTQSTNQASTTSTTSSALETDLRGTGTASTYPSGSAGGVRCNGYEELCNRKYSNVTYVIAHNSPFHMANNAASNQDFDVTTQLDNGVRGSEWAPTLNRCLGARG